MITVKQNMLNTFMLEGKNTIKFKHNICDYESLGLKQSKQLNNKMAWPMVVPWRSRQGTGINTGNHSGLALVDQ